ncbi:alpha/beta fold hydrolase [Flavobacterium endoglycinae]|uniref:Alpha/beta fold hydrolase n=2 Tax=Flavobacterium endoglycinae TaxID=2816357 RepID=A0ABX7QDZ3_9FLAO|nr:alpha/beta fold hydrolase [Flavobacterium endoglycinae]
MKKKFLFLSSAFILIITISSFNVKMNTIAQKPKLYYKVRQPKIKSEKPPLVILLHGVGSNEQNMFSFADALPDQYLVVSARGPLTFGPISFAWFQVDFSTGKPIINEKQAEAARIAILEFIDDLKTEQSFDENKVYLAGFSQGGIMSYSAALTQPDKIKGIAVMSGRLLPEIKPIIASEDQLKPLRIFISHGNQDHVLQFQYALDAQEYLKSKNLEPEFHQYNEDHTINHEMLKDLVKWLNQ